MMPDNYSEFYDLLFEAIQNETPNPLDDLEDCKEYLSSINHPRKDDASFCYDFYTFLKEPICV